LAISDSDFRNWLQQLSNGRGNPVVLIEAKHHDGSSVKTLYLSDSGYEDPTDIDAPNYKPVVLTEVVIDEVLDSSTISAIEIKNLDDAWRDYRFIGYDFHVYFGDKSWPRSDFRLQGYNKTADFTSPHPDKYRFEFDDLRSIYFDQLINGNGLGAAAGLPFVFGRVFNFEPLRNGTNRFTYYTPNIIASPVEARDNGVVVTIDTINIIADGTGDGLRIDVDLLSAPSGRVTIDIRPGVPPAAWTSSSLKIMLTQMNAYIQIPVPLGSTVDTAPTDDIGYAFYQYGSAREMLTEMCDSLGLNPRINNAGELDVIQITDGGTATRTVTDANVIGFMALDAREPPYKQLELGYRRNWAVQGTDTLAGSVSAANALLYSREHTYVKQTRTLTGYPFVKNAKVDTLIYESTDASDELDRRWNLRDVERQQWAFKGDATFIADDIADTITITHRDYGLSAGADFVVLENRKNLTRRTCQLRVWK